MIASCEVIIIAVLNKLVVSKYSVFSEVHSACFVIHEGTCDRSNHLTVHTKLPSAKILTAEGDSALTDESVTVVVEIVHFAFDFKPLVLVVTE